MRSVFRILLIGATVTGLAATACIKNPVTPEDPDEPTDEVPGDSSAANIADRPSGAGLPAVQFEFDRTDR